MSGKHRATFGQMLLQAAQELERQNPGKSRAAPMFHDFGLQFTRNPPPPGVDLEEVGRAAFDGYDVHPATDEMHLREVEREAS